MCLSSQTHVCHNKKIIVTKIILVAALTNDTMLYTETIKLYILYIQCSVVAGLGLCHSGSSPRVQSTSWIGHAEVFLPLQFMLQPGIRSLIMSFYLTEFC